MGLKEEVEDTKKVVQDMVLEKKQTSHFTIW